MAPIILLMLAVKGIWVLRYYSRKPKRAQTQQSRLFWGGSYDLGWPMFWDMQTIQTVRCICSFCRTCVPNHILSRSYLWFTRLSQSWIHRRLKSVYKQAKSYNHKATDEQVNRLLERIDRIHHLKFEHSEVIKFVRSVCKTHRENLFRFVTDTEIDGDNNRAERAIRKAVIIRKISSGNRSENGARFLETLL